MSKHIRYVTVKQLETFTRLNDRSKPENRVSMKGGMDAFEIVQEADKRADMITGQWFGITIGILPDGSSHS